MRDGKWTFEVLMDDKAQPEHVIEGHTCVEAVPGKNFKVRVEYAGEEMHQVDLLLDGKSTTGRTAIDGSGETTRPSRKGVWTGWEKTRDGQKICSSFVYAKTSISDASSEGDSSGHGLASAPNDWTHGRITMQIYGGRKMVLQHDAYERDHDPDQSGQRAAMSEAKMVKGGHSATAAAGRDKKFSSGATWRAGEAYVGRMPDDAVQRELTIFYRDSFFLMLKGDESKLLDDPAAQDASQNDDGLTDGEKKARVHARAHSDLSKKLAKKPKVKGTSAAPIDLEDEKDLVVLD